MTDTFEFLFEEYPEFAKCLDDRGYLDSLRKRNNLSLLVPTSYMSEFVEKCANDDELSDNMIKSLILNIKLDNAKEWDSVRDKITNKLNQKVDVKTITKSSIVLVGDVYLKYIRSDDTMSIWSIEKGTMSLNGQKVKVGKPVVKKQEDDTISRIGLVRDLEAKYDRGKRTIFLNFMAVLMRILKDEDRGLYNVVSFILDPSPIVSFYLLVEPYKQGNFIIPSYILKKVSSKLPNSLRSWKSNFSTPSNINSIQSIIDEIKDEITSEVGSKGQLEKIKLAYTDFADGNGIFPKLPDEVQKFYRQNVGIKLWQDGARHLIRKAFEGEETIDRDNVISEMFSNYVSGNMNTIVTDLKFYKRSGSATVYEGYAGEFIHSNLFMYIPSAPIDDGDDVISKTWEELESQGGDYTPVDDNIVRQLREIQENEPVRFEKIMKEFNMVPSVKSAEKPEKQN
jgi:hypothetical protein